MDEQISNAPLCTPALESIQRLEALALTRPQVDLQTTNLIHGGMCARTIFIPAGTVLTGALTLMDNICFVVGGITVTTDEGPMELDGFHVLPAKAGSKRAGFTHADTWWSTVIRTDLTDIAAIEEQMTPEAHRLQTRTLIEHDTTERIA